MKAPASHPEDGELETRRAAIQRELRRAQLAGKGVLAFTLGLAILAALLAQHSQRQAEEVRAQQARVEEALWRSQINEARSVLETDLPGARETALHTIAQAARHQYAPELRDAAITALSLADVGTGDTFHPFAPDAYGGEQRDPTRLTIDPGFQFITRSHHDGTVQCARLDDEQIIWEARGSGKPVQGPPVWSPNSEFLAVQSDNRLRVHELASRRLMLETACETNPGMQAPTAFSPDSRLMFAWVDKAGIIFDVRGGNVRHQLPRFEKIYHAAFHPQRPWVSLATGRQIEIWDYTTGHQLYALPSPGARGHFNHHAWRDDGRALAAAGNDNSVQIWDATTFDDQIVRTHTLHGHTLPVIYVAFNHAGDTLVSSSLERETRLWNPYRWGGESLRQLSHGYGVQFSRDDRSLALLRPSQGVSVRPVVNLPAMHRLAGPVGFAAQIADAQISPDGRWIAGVSMDGLFVWDAAANWVAARAAFQDGRCVLFRPAGNEILTSGTSGVRRWPWLATTNQAGQIEGRLGEPKLLLLPDQAKPIKMALDATQTRLVVGARNSRCYLFDLNHDAPPTPFPDQNGLDRMAFSPDGQTIVTGTWDGEETWIRDAATGRPRQKIRSSDANIGYSPDGQWLLFSKVTEHQFWSTSSHAMVKSFPREAGEQNLGCHVFLSDGRTVAWNESFNHAQLVQVDSLKVLANIKVPIDRKIEYLRASADGRWLAVFAGQIFLYDLRQLRAELSALGLDWAEEHRPAGSPGKALAPGVAMAGDASTGLVALIFTGLLVALVLGGAAQRYQRRLLGNYFELEELSAGRHQALAHAQTELQHSQKMKALGTLAAGIAHDFNNLLSVIRMANRLTAERTPGDADLQENAHLVEQSVAQGKAVVRSMLGYSRAPVERAAFVVNEAVRDTALLLNQQFLRGVHLKLELDAPTPPVTGVRSRLEQILLNLIVNSAEAMAGAGELRLAVRAVHEVPADLLLAPRASAAWVEIMVADTGPGIAAETRQRIFEPFFTTKHTGTVHGTGLGLSMVHAIAEGEGFGLALRSEPGRGVTFLIFVPQS